MIMITQKTMHVISIPSTQARNRGVIRIRSGIVPGISNDPLGKQAYIVTPL